MTLLLALAWMPAVQGQIGQEPRLDLTIGAAEADGGIAIVPVSVRLGMQDPLCLAGGRIDVALSAITQTRHAGTDNDTGEGSLGDVAGHAASVNVSVVPQRLSFPYPALQPAAYEESQDATIHIRLEGPRDDATSVQGALTAKVALISCSAGGSRDGTSEAQAPFTAFFPAPDVAGDEPAQVMPLAPWIVLAGLCGALILRRPSP